MADPDCWAQNWSVTTDNETEWQSVKWTDMTGEHEAIIWPPGSGMTACGAEHTRLTCTTIRCGRRAGHEGCHVPIGEIDRLGAISD